VRRLKHFALFLAILIVAAVVWSVFRTPARAQSGAVSVATAFSCYPQGPLACTKIQVNASTTPFPPTSICYSPSNISAAGSTRARIVTNITSISQANPAVITSTGHGFTLFTRPVVTISGVTGTGYPAINNTWVSTIIDANTFSVPFNSGALGAPTTTGSYTTTAPRTNVAEWAVQFFKNDAGPAPITSAWLGNIIAGTNLPAGPAASFSFKCSDIAGTTTPLQ
jgi:hypothetical protein